jgi:hypothetical protein
VDFAYKPGAKPDAWEFLAMTTFGDREKAFEAKFQKDQDLQFKVNARANRLLGTWAAGLLGKSGADAEAYAKEVVLADFEKPGHEDVIEKVVKDLSGKGIDASTVRKEWSKALATSTAQLMGEAS